MMCQLKMSHGCNTLEVVPSATALPIMDSRCALLGANEHKDALNLKTELRYFMNQVTFKTVGGAVVEKMVFSPVVISY